MKTIAIQAWKLWSPPHLETLKRTLVLRKKEAIFLIKAFISTPQYDATGCVQHLKFFPLFFLQELYSECDKLRQSVCQMAAESEDNDSSLGKNETQLLLIDYYV